MFEVQITAGDDSSANNPQPHGFNRWRPLLAFALFALAVNLVGYYAIQVYKQQIKQDALSELEGVATLKNEQISDWVSERKSNALTLVNDPLFLAETQSWLQRGAPDDASKARLAKRLALLQRAKSSFGYTSITLFDDKLAPRLTPSGHDGTIRQHEIADMLESMHSGRVVISDIHSEAHGANEEIEIDVVAPLMSDQAGPRHAFGVVVLHIDPARFLFPLVQRWPTASPTAESLLVRRDENEVVYLNELRHQKNTTLRLRAPVGLSDSPAVMGAMGMEGEFEGVDYRGKPVISVLHQIIDTPWTMVTKVDKDEVFAPIDRLSNWMAALMLSLIIAGAVLAVSWRKKQLRKFRELQVMHQREVDNKVLSRHLDYLSKYANDIILLVDESGHIVQFNDRALEAYGYSAEEFATLNIFDLREIDFTAQVFGEFRQVAKNGSMRFESVHARKNGELFPVEVSARSTSIGGKTYQQAIIRDITERKRAEEQLNNERARLRTLVQCIPDLVWLKGVNGEYIDCNKRFEDLLGRPAQDIIGKNDYAFVPRDKAELFRANDRQVLATKAPHTHEEWLTFASDGYRGLFETIKTPLHDGSGKLIGVMGIARDITERITAQRAIQELNADLDATLRAIPDLLFELSQDGQYINIWTQNPTLLAAQKEQLLGRKVSDVLPPEAASTVMLAIREAGLEGYSCGHEIKLDLPHGTFWFELSTSIKPATGYMRDRFIMLSRDITERKRSEEELRFKNALLTTEHETSIDGILIVNEHGKIILYNRRFTDMWGISTDILESGTHEQALQQVLHKLAEPGKFVEKVRLIYKQRDCSSHDEIELWDGRVFERYTAPMRGPQQEYYGRVSYFRDITEQKRAAKNLARSYAQLQQLTFRMEETRADERERIALNLHDEMGATLAAMKMRVAWLASKLPDNATHLSDEAARIKELVHDGIHTMHSIVSQLRPDLLGEAGLTPAIRNYVRKFQSHTDIACELRLPDNDIRLSDEQSTTAFRIMQECMNNILKHSQASKVDIIFTERSQSTTMVVKDNGIGFDTAKTKGRSFGLIGIRERALLVGGKIRITSKPGKGTRVAVSIPHSFAQVH